MFLFSFWFSWCQYTRSLWVWKTRQSLRELDNQRIYRFLFVFEFWLSPWLVVELDFSCAGWRTSGPHKRMIVSRCCVQPGI